MTNDENNHLPLSFPGKLFRRLLLGLLALLSGLGLWLGLALLKAAFAQTVPHYLVMMIFSSSMIVMLSLVGLAAAVSRLIFRPPRPARDEERPSSKRPPSERDDQD